VLVRTFQLQLAKVKDNKVIFSLLLALSAVVIWFGNEHDAGHGHSVVVKALAYLFAMWLCAFFIDLITTMKPHAGDFIVRRPLLESIIAFLCPLLGIACMLLRFHPKVPWEKAPISTRLPIGIGLMLFLFPIGMAVIMLLLRYRPKDFGFRLQGFMRIMEESGGIVNALLTGFITAALSEEFFRVVLQTRFGALFHNFGLGWLITSVMWALLHGPKWYSENQDLKETLLSCMRIVPLGLMWGYLTHRTHSILPSVLCHGMNVWGLQNF
jgi:membrane protease YdiL (CAAX protease family)